MIVKIWPIKAGAKGGGLSNTLLYIQDDQKVVEIEKDQNGLVTRRTVIDTMKEANLDATQFFIENESDISRVMEYVGNEEKIKSKYVSGYLCSPRNAKDDFFCAKNITCAHAHKEPKGGGNEIVAFHIVQSFPEGLDISDEEVHQCGIELVERLGKYQAIIASHVHPVFDEDGVAHGKCKHNHIVINAYMHPERVDPKNPDKIKYASTQRDYQMLRYWNDEIAIEHGFPIIRSPDMDHRYSWYEGEVDKKGTSWKGRVRQDIDEARRVTANLDEFIALMESYGYKIQKRGEIITFLCPDGVHKVRDRTLGKPYSKEGLETYWAIRDQRQNEINSVLKLNKDLTVEELALAKDGLYVSIPVGKKSVEHMTYVSLDLARTGLKANALNTYFRKKDHYDVYDNNGNIIAAFSGAELIKWFKINDKVLEAARTINRGQQEKKSEAEKRTERLAVKGRDPEAWKVSEDYYYNDKFKNSRTQEHYKVNKRDDDGYLYPLLNLIFILACIVLQKEDKLWKAKKIPKGKERDPIYARTDWKLQNMMDALAVAREEGLNTPADIDDRLLDIGANYSRICAALRRTESAHTSMVPVAETIEEYREAAVIYEEIQAIDDDIQRAEAEQKYAAEIEQYKKTKAVMYKMRLSSPAQIADFESRYRSVCSNLERLQEELAGAKDDYRRMKKLKNNIQLAQNAQYVYGPDYLSDRMVTEEGATDGQNKRNIDERYLEV